MDRLPGLSRRATWRVRRRLERVAGESGVLIAGSWITGLRMDQRDGWTNLFASVDSRSVGGLHPGRKHWLLWVPVRPGRRRVQVTRMGDLEGRRASGKELRASLERSVFYDKVITFRAGEAHVLVVRSPSPGPLSIPYRSDVRCWHLRPGSLGE